MELLHYWRIVRKRWWVVLLVVVLAVGATAAYTLQRPTEYQSTSTLLLNPAVPSSLVPYVQAQVASNLADSYTELMQTDSFATSVAKELNNTLSAGTIVGAIQTRLVPNTLFYKITAQASNPQTARQITDAVVKVFLSANQSPAQAQVDGGLTQNQKDMRDRLTSKLNYLSDEIKSYQDQIDTLQKQAPSKDRDDQLLQLRGLLVSLEQSETETMVAVASITKDDSGQNTAIVVDPAQPGVPVPSPLTRNLLLAFVVSLALGIGLSFFLDYLDYTVRSPEYLEQVLGLTPMAVIGIVRGQASLAYGRARRRRQGARNGKAATALNGDGKADAGTNLVTLEYPKSPESESFRVLRTNIQFSSLETPVRKLVVTSGAPGEGKSFTASNLAVVMAQSGKRVILVDTDLRRPSLHKLFGLPNTAGFTNLVVGHLSEAEKAAVLQRIPDVPNLRVITSGPLPPNPSELLNSGEAAKVMQQISQAGDVIIYDTPPVTAVTDPAILATRVDAVIYVINAGVTRRFMVERVLRILDTVGVKTVLPVLNRVKLHDIHGYYYYYSGKNYGTTSEPELSTNGHHANGRAAEVASFDGVRLDAHQDE